MVYLSRDDLEVIASQIITDYQNLYRFDDYPAEWIEPQILARDLFGLTIDYYHLSDDGSILGLTSHSSVGVEVKDDDDQPLIYCLDGRTILIEKTLREDETQFGRHNFTIMHEVSHQILGHLDPRLYRRTSCGVHYCTTVMRQRGLITDWDEWQADTLAAALLMPENLVRSALSWVGLGNGLDMLSRVRDPEAYTHFCDAAKFLGVSKQALAIRMKRLGLLKPDQRRTPYRHSGAILIDMDEEDDD